MRTTVVLHLIGRASYFHWLGALDRWCNSVGMGMTVEMIDEAALDALESCHGEPAGARPVPGQSRREKRWVWQYYPHTDIHYLIRDRVSWRGTRTRRVIIVQYATTLPGESS